MKKFNPFQKRPKDSEELDDSQLSSWQKENVKFLKREEEREQNKKEQYSSTTIDVDENKDVFHKNKYVKPTEIKEEAEPILKIVKQEKVNDSKEGSLTDEKVSGESLLNFEKEQFLDLSLENNEKQEEEKKENLKKEDSFSSLPVAKKVKWQVTIFISVIVCCLLILFYYISPLSKLESVTVVGNDLLPQNQIIKEANFKIGASFLQQYKKREQVVAELKKKNPQLKTVAIKRKGLQHLAIEVQEYPLSGYLIVQKIKYAPILSNGSIINKPINKKPNSVLYANFKQGRLLSQVMASYRHVPKTVQEMIQQITLTPSKGNKELVTIYMKDGNKVKVSGTEIAEKLKYYKQVTSQMKNKGVVDMEVGIYSYPYGNEDSQRRYSSEQLIQSGTESSTEETREVVIPDN